MDVAGLFDDNYHCEGHMALQGILFMIGIMVAIFGVTKRRTVRGKWLLAAGIMTMVIAIVLVAYVDIKTGFVDALND